MDGEGEFGFTGYVECELWEVDFVVVVGSVGGTVYIADVFNCRV